MSKAIQVTIVRGDRPIGAARLLAITALRYAIPIAFPTWTGELQLDPTRRTEARRLDEFNTVDVDRLPVLPREGANRRHTGPAELPFWVVAHARGGRDPLRGTIQITVCVADVIADQQRDVLTMPDEMVIEELQARGEPID